jgi:hypothetical protein
MKAVKVVPAAKAPAPSASSPTLFPISVTDGLLWARLGVDREFRVRARAVPGSYGIVFLGNADGTGDVAVKGISVLHARNVDAVHAALTDAIARAGRVGDPAVLVPFKCGRSETAVYYVAPWVPGGSVADLLRRREPVPLARVAAILRAVAPALDRAHEQGLVHGGIGPGNLLLGPHQRVLLADFGVNVALDALPVARNADAARSQAYTAPEQWRGGAVDGRADQYALALIAYELLTAQTRYDARGVEGVPTLEPLEINDVAALRPDLPLFVNGALRMALGAKPSNRFATVSAFVDALEGKRPGVGPGLPLVRFRIGDIKPRHVVFTLSGVLAILGIGAVGDAATHGALRSEVRQFADRYLPDAPRIPLPMPGEASLQSATPNGGGGGGMSAGGVARVMGGGGGGGGGSPGISARFGLPQSGGGNGGPHFGPEITGGTGQGASRSATLSMPNVASGKRIGSPHAPASEPAPAASPRASNDLLPSLYARARQLAARVLGDTPKSDSAAAAASSAAAAAASDGYISVDAEGGPAVVTVDGIPMGATPTTIRLAPGQHTVAVHGPRSYTPSEMTVTVTRGGTAGASFRKSR